MSGTKMQIQIFGKNIDVTELKIVKREKEPLISEYELEDGSRIRVTTIINSVVKIDETLGPGSPPAYIVYPAPSVTVIKPPAPEKSSASN